MDSYTGLTNMFGQTVSFVERLTCRLDSDPARAGEPQVCQRNPCGFRDFVFSHPLRDVRFDPFLVLGRAPAVSSGSAAGRR